MKIGSAQAAGCSLQACSDEEELALSLGSPALSNPAVLHVSEERVRPGVPAYLARCCGGSWWLG